MTLLFLFVFQLVQPADTLRLHHYVAALSHDSLTGRLAGSSGAEKAAHFIADKFKNAGLTTVEGSYFQQVYLKTVQISSETHLVIGNDTLFAGSDLSILVPNSSNRAQTFSNGLFLKSEASSTYTDDKLRGRLVLMLDTLDYATPQGSGKMTDADKIEWAKKAGASAVLLVSSKPQKIFSKRSRRKTVSTLYFDRLEETFFAARVRLPESFLNTREREVPISFHPVWKPQTGKNVWGLLEGSDPVLKNEIILLTAHYDHLGTVAVSPGALHGRIKNTNTTRDTIFNGALDNATGTAGLIYIAEQLAGGKRPKRSVLFLATTAEEQNFRGMIPFMENRPEILKEIVCNINLDIMGFTRNHGGKTWITLLGEEYSDMGGTFRKAADSLGVYIMPNYFPSYFYRSDNIIAAEKGIPAIAQAVGFEPSTVMQELETFEKYYHTVDDELGKAPISFRKMDLQTQVTAAAVHRLANATEKPKWTARLGTRSESGWKDIWGLIRARLRGWTGW